MYSSVMNAVIKLLLREIKLIAAKRRVGWGEGLPEKINTNLLAQVLGFSEVNICLDIRLRRVTFVTRKVFGDIFK